MTDVPEFPLLDFFTDPAGERAGVNLSPSYGEPLTVAELAALEPSLPDRLLALSLGYPRANGGAGLRQRIAVRYTGAAPEHVRVGCGLDDVTATLFGALVAPGDRVIVQSPTYDPLWTGAALRGADVAHWRAEEAAGWAPPLDGLEALAAAVRPALIVANFPANPTGFLPDQDYADRLASIAREAGAILVVDQIYAGLPDDSIGARIAWPDFDRHLDHAVLLDSLSKTYGLPGLRVGWMVTRNEAVLERVGRYGRHANSYLTGPSQLMAEVALDHADAIHSRNSVILAEGRRALAGFVARRGALFSGAAPTAGCNAVLRWRGPGGSLALSERLKHEHGVLLAPGRYFGMGDDHVRIGLGVRKTAENLAALDAALDSLA